VSFFTPQMAKLMSRYTKALDNIRALRKERTAELKVDRERLKFLKSDKDKAERVSQVDRPAE
jgi:hypothetical protein